MQRSDAFLSRVRDGVLPWLIIRYYVEFRYGLSEGQPSEKGLKIDAQVRSSRSLLHSLLMVWVVIESI